MMSYARFPLSPARRRPWAPAVAALLVASAALVCAPAVLAQSLLAWATDVPRHSVWGLHYDRFLQSLVQETDGNVNLEVYYRGQLASGPDIIQRVARGELAGGETSVAHAAVMMPELKLLALPMYFSSRAELDCIIDTTLAPIVAERLAARGVQVLGWTEGGSLHFVGKKPFRTPDEVRGTKAAPTDTPDQGLLWRTLGAAPAASGATRPGPGFESGSFEIALSSPIAYASTGLNKVANVITRSDVYVLPALWVMHMGTWEALGSERQAQLRSALARVPSSRLRREVRDAEQAVLVAHTRSGGQSIELSADQRAAFRKAMEPVWADLLKQAGPDAPAFYQQMQTSRDACRKRLGT
jgi:TRAP-type C4-dicarboxylate transport system substrate-binding protein